MKLISTVFLIFFFFSQPISANAILIGAGVLKAAVDDAKDVLFSLEKQTNEDITARLNQLDKILDGAISDIHALKNETVKDIDSIVNKTVSEVNKLEEKFMRHLSQKIQEVECVGKRITILDVKSALGGFGDVIGTHRIKIDAPILYPTEKTESCWVNCKKYQKEFEIKEPFNETYDEVKAFMLGRLKNAKKETPLNSFLTTYEYIADLASRASCLAPSSADRLRTEYVKFYMKAHHPKYLFGLKYDM